MIGPPAFGSMNVGIALTNPGGLKLFHHHLSLELVNRFFVLSSNLRTHQSIPYETADLITSVYITKHRFC